MSDQPGLDLNALLGQAMAMQEQLVAAQQEAAATLVEGQSGGGLVKITMNGGGEAKGVRISPDAVDLDDLTMLEDLILAALHDAGSKIAELQQSTIGQVGGGLGLGGGLGGLLGA